MMNKMTNGEILAYYLSAIQEILPKSSKMVLLLRLDDAMTSAVIALNNEGDKSSVIALAYELLKAAEQGEKIELCPTN